MSNCPGFGPKGSQLPFSSVSGGLGTSFECRKVLEWLLTASLDGIGKFHQTSIFPIFIWQYAKNINDRPGTPNYDLFKLAIKSTVKRIYPNYVNADWVVNKHDLRPIDLISTPSLDKKYMVTVIDGAYKISDAYTLENLWEGLKEEFPIEYSSEKKIGNEVIPGYYYIDLRTEKFYINDSSSEYKDYNFKLDQHIAKINFITMSEDSKKFAITTDSFRHDYMINDKVKQYESEHINYQYDYDTEMATMGCRTLIGYDRHGMGFKKSGRGNVTPITMNLVKLGIRNGICLGERKVPDIEAFWKDLDELLRISRKSLIDRYRYICSQRPAAAYFMYENETMNHSKESVEANNVEPSMRHNTLGIGFGGLSNMLYALFGKYHNQSEEVNEFGLSVVKHISEFAKKSADDYNLNFVVYASPIENSCYTMMKKLQKEYGYIKGVTDRDYINNSYHVPVYEKISIKEKIDIEAQYSPYCTSGNIQYVEFDSSLIHNEEAVEDIIRYAMEGNDNKLAYFAINFPIDTCLSCGYSAEINDKCPKCGSNLIQRLRRVTGYLTADYKTRFNLGKRQEVEDRVKHSKYTNLDSFK